MRDYLTPLLHFQRFFIPALFALVAWALWRTIVKKDLAVGLALYAGLVVIVDSFYNTGIYLPGFEKGSIRYSELCALVLFIHRRHKDIPRPSSRGVFFLVALYFGFMFVAALRSTPILAGIFDFRRFIVPQIIAFALTYRGFATLADYRRFFLCMIVLVLTVGIFDFWDIFFDRWILHSDMLFKPEYWHNRKLGRFGSVFLNPNYLGAFTVLLFPSLFIWMLHEPNRWLRVYLATGLLALLFCLVQTQSRGPLLAFGISIFILALGPVGGFSRKRRVLFLAGIVGVFAIFLPGFLEHATDRFMSLDRETSEEIVSRQTIWEYTWLIIRENPFLGIGFGEQQFLNAMAATDFQFRYGAGSLDNPHNSYLQAAAYAGLPALGAFVLANLLLLARGIRAAVRGQDQVGRAVVFGLTIGVTGFLACIYPDMHLFTQNVAPIYWVLFGLLLSLTGKAFASVRTSNRALAVSWARGASSYRDEKSSALA